MTTLQFSLLGYTVRIAQPEFLLGLAIAVMAGIFSWWAAQNQKQLWKTYFDPSIFSRVAPTASPFRRAVKNTFTSLALAFFAIALAQPQCGTHSELSKRYGIDLVIALDASSSMLAKDIAPNRLERAKIELSSLIDRLSGDRVGIVVFAGEAFVQCPLTTDYAAAKMFLQAISPSHMPVQGTDLASALDESTALLTAAEHGAKAKIIVLLTDGEDTSTEDVSSSVKELNTQGIKVFPVGIGSTTGEPIPLLDSQGNFSGWKKDRQGNTVMTRLDEKGLSEIANATNGHYLHSTSGSIGVDAVAQELNKLDKSEIESRINVKYGEQFQFFIVPGLLLLLLGAFLKHTRGRA